MTAPPAWLDAAALTDRGRSRAVNQDAVLALPDPAGRWVALVVCDGLGGLEAGDRAAELAVSAIRHGLEDGGEPLAAVLSGAGAANELILASMGPARMGTTLVAAVLAPPTFAVAHAGDSRAYLLRDGELRLLTSDHSWVNEQVVAGRMTPEQAALDSRRNVITRCIGTDPGTTLDVAGPDSLLGGDLVLLCSDGLHGVVPEEQIAAILRLGQGAAATARALIARANELGGPDNIGVALARVKFDG